MRLGSPRYRQMQALQRVEAQSLQRLGDGLSMKAGVAMRKEPWRTNYKMTLRLHSEVRLVPEDTGQP